MLQGLSGWFSKIFRSRNPFWVILGIHHRAQILNPNIIWALKLADLEFYIFLAVVVSKFVAGTTQCSFHQSNSYAIPLMGAFQGHSRPSLWLECLIFWSLLYFYSTSRIIKWLNYSVHLYGIFRLFFYITTVLILCFCITAFSLLGYYK